MANPSRENNLFLNDVKNYISRFAAISDECWASIEPLFAPLALKKGEYFAQAGKVETRLAYLASGIIRAFHLGVEGGEYNKNFFIAPCLVGAYSSLITNEANLMDYQALEDCALWSANYRDFVVLYDQFRELERVGRRWAEIKFVEKEQREIRLVTMTAAERYGLFLTEYPTLENRLPQYHIASFLGVTPIQLSRIRRDLRDAAARL